VASPPPRLAAGGSRAADPSPAELFSPGMHRFFLRVFRRFLQRHMRALRLARWGEPEAPEGRPLVVFANHPSWWDGVAFVLLSSSLFPGRRMFVPMDAEALARYAFFKRLGVFGVEQESPRGAVAFLRQSEALLASPAHMLWLNAPGRFQDVRQRPVVIAPGLLRLPELAPGAAFLPLALEMPFWSERKPELLAAFGDPLEGGTLAALPRDARREAFRQALTETMDRLAADAIARDAARFRTVEQGQEGMGGIYQAWQRVKALATGQRFDPRHDPRA
jgi:1-acyl-sn-glycerol-3-phosphate acyltransferase